MSKTVSNPQFWGMVIYEKMGDGCLNGLWNNNDVNNTRRIHNEIARKKGNKKKDVAGDYTVSWIERNGEAISGILR